MDGLTRLAIRSLLARPLRASLTTAGVALGVGVLFAGLATNAAIEASAERTVQELVGLERSSGLGLRRDRSRARDARRHRSDAGRRHRGTGPRATDVPRGRPVVRAAAAVGHRAGDRPGHGTAAARPRTGRGYAPVPCRRTQRPRHAAPGGHRWAGHRLGADRHGRRAAGGLPDHRHRGGQRATGRRRWSNRLRAARHRPVGLRHGRRDPRRHRSRARREPAGRHRRLRGRIAGRAVRRLDARGSRRLPARLDGGLPGHDRDDRRDRPVHRRVPHLQHALDDGHRAVPRGRSAARSRGDAGPGPLVHPDPGPGRRDRRVSDRDRARGAARRRHDRLPSDGRVRRARRAASCPSSAPSSRWRSGS